MAARNGKQSPPRPKLEISAPNASPEEAAAITAALEQFLIETAPAPQADARTANPWQRTALVEGISGRVVGATGWGPSQPR